MARRTLRKLRHLCMMELYQSVRVQRLTAASKKKLGRQITRSSPIALWGFSNIERWMSKTRQKVLYQPLFPKLYEHSQRELRAERAQLEAVSSLVRAIHEIAADGSEQ